LARRRSRGHLPDVDPARLPGRRRSRPRLLRRRPGHQSQLAAAGLPAHVRRGGKVLHVLKRLLLAIVAYALAGIVGLVAVVVIYAVLSSLPGAPAYFSTMSMSPLIVILLPPVGLLVLYVALILTCLPSLALALISELFSLRQAWLFGLVGALIAA